MVVQFAVIIMCTYLSSWVDFQDFLRFVLSFLKGQQFAFVTLQLLLLQSDHNTPAGR